jgi:hypothetical protein
MTIINIETLIHIPPTELFALHSDFRKRPLWHDHVIASELLTSEPIGVGSCFHTTNKSGLITLTTREQITVFTPPHRYCYELDSGLFHIYSCQRFTAVSEGTYYQIEVKMQARNWLGEMILPLIASRQRPHFLEAAQEFKRYCEANG